jgi:hypothetical protein
MELIEEWRRETPISKELSISRRPMKKMTRSRTEVEAEEVIFWFD